jgi:hypothetical protein
MFNPVLLPIASMCFATLIKKLKLITTGFCDKYLVEINSNFAIRFQSWRPLEQSN